MDDNENKIKTSYDEIADEYESCEHKTCRNFDYVTRRYILDNFDNDLNECNPKILEIGAGNCWISRLIADIYEGCEIYATDISAKMIIQGEKMSSIYPEIHFVKEDIPARNIVDAKVTFPNKNVDLIICGLADPYMNKEFLTDILPILNEEGKILITVPTRTWAHNLRRNIDKVGNVNETWHTTNDDIQVKVPSICMNISDLKDIIPDEYHICDIRELKLDNKIEPSKWVQKVADLLHINVLDLPIVTVAVIEKKGDDYY